MTTLKFDFEVDTNFYHAGAWAGSREIVSTVVDELTQSPDYRALLQKHAKELRLILPERRTSLPDFAKNLTETARGDESTRNYPLARSLRIIHGLVDLVLHWKDITRDGQVISILLDHYDACGFVGQCFFLELSRRGFDKGVDVYWNSVDGPIRITGHEPLKSMHLQANLSLCGAPDIRDNKLLSGIALEAKDPEFLVATWPYVCRQLRDSGSANDIFFNLIKAVSVHAHEGLYHEAAAISALAMEYYSPAFFKSEREHWLALNAVFQARFPSGLSNAKECREFINNFIFGSLTSAEFRAKAYYLRSMTYVRFISEPNLPHARRDLEAALRCISAIDNEDTRVFLEVFLKNGLALVELREGSHDMALHLCKQGEETVNDYFGEGRHKLHKSVLIYNIAKVYDTLNHNEKAEVYYNKAIKEDPFYSEYYNDLGNLLQKMGRHEEASCAYENAVRLSPPYHEVYFNLGICMYNLGRTEEAIKLLSRSLELNPQQPEILLMLADMWSDRGDDTRALLLYCQAALNPKTRDEALINASVVLVQMDQKEGARALLNRLIQQDRPTSTILREVNERRVLLRSL